MTAPSHGQKKRIIKHDNFSNSILTNNNILNSSDELKLYIIAYKMKKAGLGDLFIVTAVKLANKFEGVSDLLHLWEKEKDKNERNEIIADIQDMIDACSQEGKVEESYVKFNDLDAIAKDVRKFKDSLYEIVMARGGINKLAELTGIPQPSLSRFFSSDSMPQRSTVLKIAKALNLDRIEINMKWSK